MQLKILVVDDDFFVLAALRKLLERQHSVRTVSDGESALRAAETFRPDVVFVDLLLAYENGLDLLEGLRPMLPGAHLVLMTAFPGAEIIHEAAACGADSFVAKQELPVVVALLEQLLAERGDGSGHHQR